MSEVGADVLRALLALDGAVDVDRCLDEMVRLLVRATHARAVYLAVGGGFEGPRPRWCAAHAANGEGAAAIRDRISSGLVGEALRTGWAWSSDALRDLRFADRDSVQRHQTASFACAALYAASGTVPIGVLYVEGLDDRRPFDAATLELIRLMAGHLGPHAARVLTARWTDGPDPTEPFRKRLKARALVGRSAALARVLEALTVACAAPIPVLLTGPTGTGKSAVARVIHDSSAVAAGPFVEVNAAHLRPDLAVAELFGARAGSYTGATRDRAGLVEEARRGTLFVDEVAELDATVQAQLLTFLQDGTVRRLGDVRSHRVADVRVITATHRDLRSAVASGGFREDLYHRLAAFEVAIPGLDARSEDVVELAWALVDRAAQRYGLRPLPLSAAAAAWLETRRWPGNVRALENTVQRGLLWAHAAEAPAIRPEHLDRDHPPDAHDSADLRQAVERFKGAFVARVLAEAQGNKAEAARRLGITRQHLHQLLRQPRAPEGRPGVNPI